MSKFIMGQMQRRKQISQLKASFYIVNEEGIKTIQKVNVKQEYPRPVNIKYSGNTCDRDQEESKKIGYKTHLERQWPEFFPKCCQYFNSGIQEAHCSKHDKCKENKMRYIKLKRAES